MPGAKVDPHETPIPTQALDALESMAATTALEVQPAMRTPLSPIRNNRRARR